MTVGQCWQYPIRTYSSFASGSKASLQNWRGIPGVHSDNPCSHDADGPEGLGISLVVFILAQPGSELEKERVSHHLCPNLHRHYIATGIAVPLFLRGFSTFKKRSNLCPWLSLCSHIVPWLGLKERSQITHRSEWMTFLAVKALRILFFLSP